MAWTQPELFSLPAFPPDPDLDAPKRPPLRIAPGDIPRQRWYDYLADAARRLAELHGWSQDVRWATLRALVALDQPGQPYHHSHVEVLRGYHNANGARAREVLELLGLLVDDRPDPRQQWLDQRLAGLAAQIRAELAEWARVLYHGDERARPKSERTWKPYVTAVVTAAQAWSARYQSLREVTRDDVVAVLAADRDSRTLLTAIRSLFATLRSPSRATSPSTGTPSPSGSSASRSCRPGCRPQRCGATARPPVAGRSTIRRSPSRRGSTGRSA